MHKSKQMLFEDLHIISWKTQVKQHEFFDGKPCNLDSDSLSNATWICLFLIGKLAFLNVRNHPK